MNLHEYQAKQLFSQFNLAIPKGIVVRNIAELAKNMAKLKGNKWIVKAQVHAGGRGKAGGVVLVNSVDESYKTVKNMLGVRLVTEQTDKQGQPINSVLIEQVCDIERELYLGMLIDRKEQKISVIASTQGGMDIEKVAKHSPEKILKIIISPQVGIMPYQIREMIFGLKLCAKTAKQFALIVKNLLLMFVKKDLSLVEINPLVVTKTSDIVCLDGKVNIDNNALYRQQELAAIIDTSQTDKNELIASKQGLNYISLSGNVGCMVNGAGLAMATMDLIKLCGGKPANFLDVGGSVTADRVAIAFNIILSDSNVRSVLVNIFGGIVRCDLIADGILEAVSKIKINVPLIVRLEGNNAKLGLEKLQKSEFDIIVVDSLMLAAQKAVVAAKMDNK